MLQSFSLHILSPDKRTTCADQLDHIIAGRLQSLNGYIRSEWIWIGSDYACWKIDIDNAGYCVAYNLNTVDRYSRSNALFTQFHSDVDPVVAHAKNL